ncbi:HEAT repeat domain-containing protein [Dyadobacter sp. CY327]|uniref:PVC-type heme-binding CxxCH protein n=1 Tax=Dyadobacter sp. CY327 TaxID=2907301 RepID=UPI001F395ABD|nr:PVC-type heme-binding CxxCH protein [Dyadobacter sp. CY327]MCE7070817.1 HEAT repeat domain-containing protein [Dyadobacter sp. CY327]
MYYTGKLFLVPLILLALLAGTGENNFKNTLSYASADSARLKKAMGSFRLEPGLRIELIAAEPLVMDPVALAFDENRRMYVVEDSGYPDPAEGGTPTTLGRIALLEDRDGDGKYDHRSEFATGLTYPNGLMVWKGGIFVTCAPDIFYFKDTDGDGVADIKQVVLTGFSNKQTAQIRVSHPTLGLDGKVYVTSGLNSGEVTSPLYPDRPAVSFSASDSRFNPETFEFEITGGRSQYGLTFDAYGRRFGCSNRHPVRQILMEPWYLRRNPHLTFTETTENVSKVEAEATVSPISGAVTSAEFIPKLIGLSHTGTFTSASGVTIFNGTGLTPAHRGNVFICESAQNLVQRQIVSAKGVSFASELPYKGKEFLSSTDEWFRPVFLQHGPEGALYVADMHRKVIDHPSYVPEEARSGLDFESGKTDGRIYRIVNSNFKDKKQVCRFGTMQELVAALQSPEEWERQTAHRLLLEKRKPDAVPFLKQIVATSKISESRLRALWLLDSYGETDGATLKTAWTDKDPGVRENVVSLSGNVYQKYPALLTTLTSAASDPAARVRFTAALVLGSIEGKEAIASLSQIAAKDGADRWVRAAVLSGIGNRLPEFLAAFRPRSTVNPGAYTAVMQDLGQLFGNGAPLADCRVLLKEVITGTGNYGPRISTALGLAEGINRRTEIEKSPKGVLYGLLGTNASAPEKHQLDKFISQASIRAGSSALPPDARVTAAALLGYTGFDKSGPVLRKLMDAKNTPELQLETVAALARQGDARGGAFLTEKQIWKNYTPQVKSAVVSALVSKPVFIEVLFSAIQQGVIAPAEISSMDRQRLMKHKEKAVSDRAEDLFRELEGGGRMKVYRDYRDILNTKADAKPGKAVFEKACSACHTYAGQGGKVGPDLTGVRNQPADALLLHILVPNYEVYPAYQAISVETNDGRSFSGWLMAETDNSLTLKTAFGTQESILRKNIKSLTNSGLSLMPEGLEQTMTKDELAQLIAFLKGSG